MHKAEIEHREYPMVKGVQYGGWKEKRACRLGEPDRKGRREGAR